MSSQQPINLSALPTGTLDEFIEAREIAAGLLGWELQTDTVLVNGQPEERVRTQRRYPHLPVYKPTGNRHYDVQHGYVYEFVVNDLVLPGGRAMWELVVYFVGTPAGPAKPAQVFYRQYAKAQHALQVIQEVYLPQACRQHSEQRVAEWAKTPEGQAAIATWAASPGGQSEIAFDLNQLANRIHECRATRAGLRRRLDACGDPDECALIRRQGNNLLAVLENMKAGVARLEALATESAPAPVAAAPWDEEEA